VAARLWAMPLALIAACLALAALITFSLPSRYESPAAVQSSRVPGSLDPARTILTDSFLAKLVAPGLTLGRLRGDLRVLSRGTTTYIFFVSSDPREAADVANRVARLFAEESSARTVLSLDSAVPARSPIGPNRLAHILLGLLTGLLGATAYHMRQLALMRRSPRRPGGLGLVVSGSLALPLLALDGLLAMFWHWLLAERLRGALVTAQSRESVWGQAVLAHASGIAWTAAVLSCLAINCLLSVAGLPTMRRRRPMTDIRSVE
jgi:hypothetical protein